MLLRVKMALSISPENRYHARYSGVGPTLKVDKARANPRCASSTRAAPDRKASLAPT